MEVEKRVRLLDAAFDKAKAADYATALEEFEFLESQSEHPQDIAPLRLFQASCLTDMRKAAEALDRIRSVDQNQLGFANLVVFEFEYARILRALGDREDALKRTRNALKAIDTVDDKKPTEVVARNLHTLWGVLLAELGRCDEAIPVLEQVPVEDEGWADASLHLGDCKYKKRQYRDAIKNYQDVVSCKKGNGPFLSQAALRNIGYAFYDLEEYAKAVEYLTKVEGQYDAYPDMKKELFSILASSYLHLGKPSEAQKYRYPSSGSQLLQ
jgi:tetratricopeptide (TPR) repeat protein